MAAMLGCILVYSIAGIEWVTLRRWGRAHETRARLAAAPLLMAARPGVADRLLREDLVYWSQFPLSAMFVAFGIAAVVAGERWLRHRPRANYGRGWGRSRS